MLGGGGRVCFWSRPISVGGGGRGSKRSAPLFLGPQGEPAHGLHPRFVVPERVGGVVHSCSGVRDLTVVWGCNGGGFAPLG